MMDINLIELIKPELIILVAVIYGLGMFLKSIPNFPDWTIPLVLLVVAVALTIVYKAVVLGDGFCGVTIVNGVVYGVLIATIAVYANNVVKQVTVKRKEE